jgi:hypothetical protein
VNAAGGNFTLTGGGQPDPQSAGRPRRACALQLAAAHAFLALQIAEHKTGDPTTASLRPAGTLEQLSKRLEFAPAKSGRCCLVDNSHVVRRRGHLVGKSAACRAA